MRRRGGFRTCRGQSARFVETKRPFSLPRLELGVSRLLLPLLAASLRFQKRRKRKDHSLKKFSGLRPARQDAACAFCIVFYSTNWPQGSESSGFYRVPGSGSRASQEASETAPRGQDPQAPQPGPPKRPQPPGQAPPRGRRCVCYCVLQSKLASGLKNLRFFNGFRAPKRPQVRFLLCFTDQTCLRS